MSARIIFWIIRFIYDDHFLLTFCPEKDERCLPAEAVGAGLLIAGVFIAAGAVAITLLLLFWH